MKKLRTARELSQAALAARCQRLGWDASREMVNHIEMQVRLVREYEAVAIAKALGVKVGELLPSEAAAFKRLSGGD